MDISVGHFFLIVNDPDEALGFYRDALGLEVRNDVSSEFGRWITLSPPGQDVEMIVSTPESGRSKQDSDQVQALVTKGALGGVLFKAADLDATFEKVRASGAEVLQEPMDQSWGSKDCAFRDPSGNMVRISQA